MLVPDPDPEVELPLDPELVLPVDPELELPVDPPVLIPPLSPAGGLLGVPILPPSPLADPPDVPPEITPPSDPDEEGGGELDATTTGGFELVVSTGGFTIGVELAVSTGWLGGGTLELPTEVPPVTAPASLPETTPDPIFPLSLLTGVPPDEAIAPPSLLELGLVLVLLPLETDVSGGGRLLAEAPPDPEEEDVEELSGGGVTAPDVSDATTPPAPPVTAPLSGSADGGLFKTCPESPLATGMLEPLGMLELELELELVLVEEAESELVEFVVGVDPELWPELWPELGVVLESDGVVELPLPELGVLGPAMMPPSPPPDVPPPGPEINPPSDPLAFVGELAFGSETSPPIPGAFSPGKKELWASMADSLFSLPVFAQEDRRRSSRATPANFKVVPVWRKRIFPSMSLPPVKSFSGTGS